MTDMKGIVLFFILGATTVFAQNTSGCCPGAIAPSDVVKPEHLAVSGLICSEVEVKDFESYIPYEADANSQASTEIVKIEKMLKNCHENQKEVLTDIVALTAFVRDEFKKKDIYTFEKALEQISLMVDAELSSKIISKTSEDIHKSDECKHCDLSEDSKKVKFDKKLNKAINLLVDFKSQFHIMKAFCPDYKVNAKEKSYLKKIETIEALRRSSKSER